MTSTTKVSVLILTYQHERFIERAILSALDQTRESHEIVVADDGSRDGTPAIIQCLAGQHATIVPLLSPANRGLSANWNAGLDRCSGEYLALLSGDDLMLPGKLMRQVAFLEANPQYGLCTHDMEVFDSASGKTFYISRECFPAKSGGLKVPFATNWFFRRHAKTMGSSILARAEFFRSHRVDERLKIWNEWLWVIECMATTGLGWGHVPELLGRYRVHEGQLSRQMESFAISFEEAMMVLSIADVRYPDLSRLIKNKREFILFEHLVRDWHPPEKRRAFSAQFRREAGLLKWLYMKLAHAAMHSPMTMAATRPVRALLKRSAINGVRRSYKI